MDEKGFENFIKSLSTKAEQGNWIPRYDKELDHFYWTRKEISDDARLVKVSHETSLYYTPTGKVEGVFVEYMSQNFVTHNPSYVKLLKKFTKKIDKNTYTLENKKDSEVYLFALSESLRADIYHDAEVMTNGKLHFDALVKAAFAQ